MKKFIITILACVMISCAFTGCGYDPYMDGTTAPTTATDATEKKEKESKNKTYENSLSGLIRYMDDKEYIDSENKDAKVKMDAELIGAKKGFRYSKGTALVELYQFDLKKLNKTGEETLKSIDNNGYFTIFDKNITAYVTMEGKYMMVYTDSSADAVDVNEAEKTRLNAIEDFQSFEPTK